MRKSDGFSAEMRRDCRGVFRVLTEAREGREEEELWQLGLDDEMNRADK